MHPQAQLVSFGELVENMFEYGYEVQPAFHDERDPRWKNRGNTVRGAFRLLRLGEKYRAADVSAALAAQTRLLGRPFWAATAYELLTYIEQGWKEKVDLVAFGSSYTKGDELNVPCVRVRRGEIELVLEPTSEARIWSKRYHILCVY